MKVSAIKKIKPADHKPDSEIVSCLEKLLTRAKSGEIQHMAVVTAKDISCGDTEIIGNRVALLAGIERLKFRLMIDWIYEEK
jgi:hypothetical protein